MNTSTAERVVHFIPAVDKYAENPFTNERVKRRVAGYGRVSTNSDEQQESYEAQVEYYTDYIKSKSDEWDFVNVYADEAISGTNTLKRDEFNRMIRDALDGKIDLIVTKSVSRFARNTVDTLVTVRKLKDAGVEVFFEKENIYTFDSKGELLLTIMSSLAQEESRSISENVTWGQRKRMADGKINLPYKKFLGYKKGADGLPEIVESEAEIVREIYYHFLCGKTPSSIAANLTGRGVPSPGKGEQWYANTIESILTNEKYKGAALLQKQFTVDFLTKKKKINEGEVPQYYIEKSHTAIIDPFVFDMVQHEIKQRKGSGKWTSAAHCFSGRIYCGECGEMYGSKVWNTGKYRRKVWNCNQKHYGEQKCDAPHLTDEEIQAGFVTAFNKLVEDKDEIITAFSAAVDAVFDTTALDNEIEKLKAECEIVKGLIEKVIDENARTAQNQAEYMARYEELKQRGETAARHLKEITDARLACIVKHYKIKTFIETLETRDLITEFDEELWYLSIDRVDVRANKNLIFKFKSDTTVEVALTD